MSTKLTTEIISWTGFFTGLASLCISGVTAWFNALRQAKIVGVLSGLEFIKKFNIQNGALIEAKIKPILFIKNIGAQNAVIELIRIKFYFTEKDYLFVYPTSYNSENKQRHFSGISLAKNETWENTFPFHIKDKDIEKLVDKNGKISVEIKMIDKKNWNIIRLNKFDFKVASAFLKPLFPNTGETSSFIWSNTIKQK